MPIRGGMLAIDPYSSESEMVFHYLLNKHDIATMSEKMQAENRTGMDFGLSLGTVIPEFGSSFAITVAAMIASFMMIAAYQWQRRRK